MQNAVNWLSIGHLLEPETWLFKRLFATFCPSAFSATQKCKYSIKTFDAQHKKITKQQIHHAKLKF